jgi:predicted DNA-binding protein
MSDDANKVRLQVMVEPEIAARVDDLAERLKTTRSRLLAELLSEALNDNEWIIRFVTSSFVTPLREWVQGQSRKRPRKDATA